MAKTVNSSDDILFNIGENDSVIVIRSTGEAEAAIPDSQSDSHIAEDSPTWKATVAMVMLEHKELFDDISNHIKDENSISFYCEPDDGSDGIPGVEGWQ